MSKRFAGAYGTNSPFFTGTTGSRAITASFLAYDVERFDAGFIRVGDAGLLYFKTFDLVLSHEGYELSQHSELGLPEGCQRYESRDHVMLFYCSLPAIFMESEEQLHEMRIAQHIQMMQEMSSRMSAEKSLSLVEKLSGIETRYEYYKKMYDQTMNEQDRYVRVPDSTFGPWSLEVLQQKSWDDLRELQHSLEYLLSIECEFLRIKQGSQLVDIETLHKSILELINVACMASFKTAGDVPYGPEDIRRFYEDHMSPVFNLISKAEQFCSRVAFLENSYKECAEKAMNLRAAISAILTKQRGYTDHGPADKQ